MSFPKKGKSFPERDRDGIGGGGYHPSPIDFAAEISAALQRTLGSTHSAVKTASGWTGANERTAKNWLSGRYGPSGEHLVALARNSEEVLNTFLAMCGRSDLIAASKLAEAEQILAEVLTAVHNLNKNTGS